MLTLRPFCESDIQPLTTILNQPDVVRYLSTKIPYPYTTEDAKWWVAEGSQSGVVRAIEVDEQLVGCIGVMPGEFEYERSGEIGYWLAQSHWRRGITSQAIKLIVEEVFTTTQLERIFATVFSSNHPSKQLLLRCGFTQEATLKKAIFKNGQFYDSCVFAIIKD
ncbi:GNAT family N-acetyltransferase [Alteromonas lipolytica]|uniref:GNAT family N-acetyltransferase n=1 Tax=Alteromonas lipolytica TaxID=1856405 RepID=A0A1E8FF73_9ALTE|nr:GNAT family protein [Alteromonas lipolytica]OFI34143.1 GNAT family N-acetyltransferase [Alteromonas lipolytica]GGF65021.1 N-acetyltransferase [Alteromonas lipolytica]